ncbi:bile acid:sodium symporter family protein [Agriterribacter sp.]|uniref:bile acid:sodium symporter family protein n=1 Tax=Agriterribacter sp. TaxID=2821509 RepID=UPI002BFD164D|nr:bile acid:sodium symporter family protein [Agriterribacter sp.]HRO48358.1 bile acid:sodium symporter family protein [Agriterribacter sp.]HRQ19563.1 bile acid:sodium symporter family protein [Agriterribacter sp.]
MKLDKFVLALFIAVGVAWFFPQFGSAQSGIPLDAVCSAGIALIFFFYGVKLSPEKIKAGLKNWKLHIVIQAATFIICPLLVLIFYPFLKNEQQEMIWLSVFFLAALPSTVSSSVVMVAMAKGNLPAAIFNASISGLIGIVLTPLWMGLFLQQQGDVDFLQIYFKLIVEIIIPVIAGTVMQRAIGHWVARYGKQLSVFDKSIIVLIVYKSFAESFSDGTFSGMQWNDLAMICGISVALFFALYGIIYCTSKLLAFNKEDMITALFCGSKKSLVHGTVFSKVLFSNAAFAGFMLLPLMIFHAFQLFMVSYIAGRFAGKE